MGVKNDKQPGRGFRKATAVPIWKPHKRVGHVDQSRTSHLPCAKKIPSVHPMLAKGATRAETLQSLSDLLTPHSALLGIVVNPQPRRKNVDQRRPTFPDFPVLVRVTKLESILALAKNFHDP